jgi:chorismate mutase
MDIHIQETFKKITIAGPCALESRAQIIQCVEELKKLGVEVVRACLWKPRTVPGWEGLGFLGLPMLLEETLSRDVTPASEIMTPIHAQMCVDALKHFGDKGRMIVWIGARNQNHFEIHRMAHILAEGPPSLLLMFKNQVWLDKKHWYGIYQHIIHAGFPQERLLSCHRGFHPHRSENPLQLRNLPEYEMAMELKESMGIPMLLDPSHIAGARDKVFQVVEESFHYDFDGYMIEVHHDIDQAKTDVNQQLTFDQLGKLLEMIKANEESLKHKLVA